jgi:P27 family predicted phage terminase small subunit
VTGRRGPVSGNSYGQKSGPKADPDRPKRATKALEALPSITPSVPPVPDDLGVVGKAIWQDLWSGLVILSPKIEGHTVRRYCEAADDAAAARAEISARGVVLDELIGDARGGVLGHRAIVNPAILALKNSERTMTELADRLGLSPSSRARLGLTISLAELAAAEAGRVLGTMFSQTAIDIEESKRW